MRERRSSKGLTFVQRHERHLQRYHRQLFDEIARTVEDLALVALRLDLEERPFRPEAEVGGDPREWTWTSFTASNEDECEFRETWMVEVPARSPTAICRASQYESGLASHGTATRRRLREVAQGTRCVPRNPHERSRAANRPTLAPTSRTVSIDGLSIARARRSVIGSRLTLRFARCSARRRLSLPVSRSAF